jgi:hypothetical protein
MVGASVGAAITMVKAWAASGGVPLAAVMEPVNVPAEVGTPDMTPALLMLSPAGKPEAVKVMGAVPVAETTNW